MSGQKFDLRSARGKIVILHFWETWCCDDDEIEELQKLKEKYKGEVVVIGCNIEGQKPIQGQGEVNLETPSETTKRVQGFIRGKKAMTWPQLHAVGSVDDSPLAHQLGIATEPVIILIDKAGNLVENNIAASGLEREIERERRRKASSN